MSLKCILQGQDLSKESLEAHIADKNNPHGVTPQQIGAATLADIPTSLPASDVYSWAKQPNKPSYTYSEVGAAASNHNHNNLYPTLTDFNSLKTSVSNGKSAVASAITDKGVSTSATASFDTMAGNIRSINIDSPSPISCINDDTYVIYSSGHNFGCTLYTPIDNPTIPTSIGLKIFHENQLGTNWPWDIYDYDEVILPVGAGTTSTTITKNVGCKYTSGKIYNTDVIGEINNYINPWSSTTHKIKYYISKSSSYVGNYAINKRGYRTVSIGISSVNDDTSIFSNSHNWSARFRFIW